MHGMGLNTHGFASTFFTLLTSFLTPNIALLPKIKERPNLRRPPSLRQHIIIRQPRDLRLALLHHFTTTKLRTEVSRPTMHPNRLAFALGVVAGVPIGEEDT
jgi:hypothetical protein